MLQEIKKEVQESLVSPSILSNRSVNSFGKLLQLIMNNLFCFSALLGTQLKSQRITEVFW